MRIRRWEDEEEYDLYMRDRSGAGLPPAQPLGLREVLSGAGTCVRLALIDVAALTQTCLATLSGILCAPFVPAIGPAERQAGPERP